MLAHLVEPPHPPGVTVLLPVFFRDADADRVRLLRDALESVHVQRFPAAYEILVVDDGSPSPIEALAPRLGHEAKAVRFIRLQHNCGIAAALNRGLAEARYPFIARLDHDDRWLETKIEKQLALFAGDPDLTIAGTGMTVVTPLDEPIETHVRPGSWAWALDFLAAGGSPLPHGSVLARRDIYRLLGGYPLDGAYRYCEDYALWADWLRFFKPGMVEEALYRYTVSPGSVSVAHREQQIRASILVRQRFDSLAAARIPEALDELSAAMGCTLLEAGFLAFKMWRFGAVVRLPASAVGPLETIMPDRRIRTGAEAEGPRDVATVLERDLATPDGSRPVHAASA
ncbi:MAG TPA: glycosyltransferase [Beijerinckiaceae bacterium]|jgi:glycosyltransferase involved in cell wall biosynthesis